MSHLNHAIALYVGRGSRSFPGRDASAVLNHFGAIDGSALVAQVRAMLAELDEVKPDWERHDLIGATQYAVDVISARHPVLDDEGRAALGWCYGFWYR